MEIPRVEELLRSLMQGLPPGLASGASGLREDLENNFRAVLRANLGKLDLAGRDEFDAQRKVLERTRARLEALEQRVAELEAKANASDSSQSPPHGCRRNRRWTQGGVMGIARVASRAQLGLSAPRVEVEVHLGQGLPTFSIVGLPATAVKESKDRVRAALAELRIRFPRRAHHRQSLARGPAQGRLPLRPSHRARHPAGVGAARSAPSNAWRTQRVLRRAGLAGELKPIKGVLLAAAHAAREGRNVVVPAANLAEARLAAPTRARGADTLLGVCALVRGNAFDAAGVGDERRRGSPRRFRATAASISPMCAVRPRRKRALSSPRQAATASCWSARRAPARACSRNDCRACCRARRRRGARRRVDRISERARLQCRATTASGPSARHITPRPPAPSSAAVRRRGPAR